MSPYNPEPWLTPKEREVLILLARGHSAIQAARIMGTKRRTIDTHMTNARQKFDAQNTLHLVVLALHEGLITLEEICQKPTTD